MNQAMYKALTENCHLVARVLAVNTNMSFNDTFIEDKDSMRAKNIYKKDSTKWLREAENMANKITTTEKAVRRARAIVASAPPSADEDLVSKMTKTFLRRSVMLHVADLDAMDIAKLRLAGAIK